MKNKAISRILKGVLPVVVIAFILGGYLGAASNSNAAEGKATIIDEVRYVEYDISDCVLGQAPTYTKVDEDYGYLFGGWYRYDGTTYVPIVNEADKSGVKTAYAKFVPAYVLGVKCQNFAWTTAESTSTSIRIVSSVDALTYQKVGFDLMKIDKNADGTYTEKVIGKDGGQTTMETYSGLLSYASAEDTNPKTYSPEEIFGVASKYLTTWRVNKIPNASFGTIICIRPYWITADGTTVYGLSRYAHVEDGYLSYINVPINLNNKNAVAAGLLNVSYDASRLEFVDAERGRVLQEMVTVVDMDDVGIGKVKCAGVLEDMSKDAASDHIYINLRFKVAKNAAFDEGTTVLDFEVDKENFSNVTETLLEGSDYDVWKVRTSIMK